MLTIKRDDSSKELHPNLLPCSIRHDGTVPITEKHWTPTSNADGSQTAYFRGRKLFGNEIKLPEGYEGVLLKKTDEVLVTRPKNFDLAEDVLEEAAQGRQPKIARTQAVFDKVTVWGHEVIPAPDHQHVKAIQEWIAFAEAMHASDEPTDQ